jgi:hypothetical protein
MQYTQRLALVTIIGGAMLLLASVVGDVAFFTGQIGLGSFSNGLSLVAGALLFCLPLGLHATGIVRGVPGWLGTACWCVGNGLLSFVIEGIGILRPNDTSVGIPFALPGLILLSLGALGWFVAIQRGGALHGWQKWLFLFTGLWFFLTFPTIQLPLFVLRYGQPLFTLMSGVYGLLFLLMGLLLRRQASSATFPPQREAVPR